MDYPSLIVIENSANCNYKCKICPTVYAEHYPKKFMEMKIFSGIIKNVNFNFVKKSALMGWGEPLLDPTYFLKLKILKEKHVEVGSTTNLSLIDKNIFNEIVEYGLDQFGISIDDSHLVAMDENFAVIDKKLHYIFDILERKQSKMKIYVNVIVLKNNIDLIHKILDCIIKYPFFNIGISPLIILPSEKLKNELLRKEEYAELTRELKLKYTDLPMTFQYIEDNHEGNCRSDVFNNLYINYEGYVSPCCMLAMKFPNISFKGKKYITNLLRFGNVASDKLIDIWQDKQYVEFRNTFRNGLIPNECDCCNSWRNLPENSLKKEMQ